MGILDAPAADAYARTISVFNPTKDLPKCVLWLNADNIAGANNSAVRHWPDASLFSHDVSQGTVANQPTLKTSGGPNSHRYVAFGSAGILTRLAFGYGNYDIGVNAGYTQPNSIIIVARTPTGQTNSANLTFIDGGPSGHNTVSLTQSENTLFGRAGSTGASGGVSHNDGQWHVYVYQFDVASTSAWCDGYFLAAGLTQAGTNPLQFLSIGGAGGGSSAPSEFCNSDIAEVIVCNERLSYRQVSAVSKALGAKYGISVADQPAPLTWVDTNDANAQAVRYWLPKNWQTAASLPLVIWCHPYSQGYQIVPGYFMAGNLAAWVNAGYMVVSPNMHVNQWGNSTAQTDIAAAHALMNGIVPVSRTIMAGGSMGGMACANAVVQATVPNIKGVHLQDAILDLATIYSQSGYTASINTAYSINAGTLAASVSVSATSISSTVSFANGTQIMLGNGTANVETVTVNGAPSGAGPYTIPITAATKSHASADQVSDFPTQLVGWNPMTAPIANWAGKRFRAYASTSDSVAVKTTNSDAFATRIAATAAETTVLTHTAGHTVVQGTWPMDALAFANRAV